MPCPEQYFREQRKETPETLKGCLFLFGIYLRGTGASKQTSSGWPSAGKSLLPPGLDLSKNEIRVTEKAPRGQPNSDNYFLHHGLREREMNVPNPTCPG